MRMYAMQGGMEGTPTFPVEYTLTVNTAAALTARLSQLCDSEPEKAELLAAQVYRLCLLSQRRLTAEELTDFLSGSFDLLSRI